MKQLLNFGWSFVNGYQESYLKALPENKETVDIPHSAVKVPYNYFNELDYQKLFTYEKIFDVEDDLNKVYILHFAGLMVKTHIYLNDVDFGVLYSAYLPIDLDVSSAIKQKGNRLLVIVDGSEDENCPPFGFAVDYLTFAGIYREVELISHPKTYLKNIYVDGKMDGSVTITYDKVGAADIKIKHQIYFDKNEICEQTSDEFKVLDVELWDLDHPNLYTLRTIIESKDGTDEYLTRFGFREVSFRKDGFFLNNKRVKIVGMNRHQGYPIVGYAMPESMQKEDADILKEIGLNGVRTSHYPQCEHFLDRCGPPRCPHRPRRRYRS